MSLAGSCSSWWRVRRLWLAHSHLPTLRRRPVHCLRLAQLFTQQQPKNASKLLTRFVYLCSTKRQMMVSEFSPPLICTSSPPHLSLCLRSHCVFLLPPVTLSLSFLTTFTPLALHPPLALAFALPVPFAFPSDLSMFLGLTFLLSLNTQTCFISHLSRLDQDAVTTH